MYIIKYKEGNQFRLLLESY